jgi:hypothetical protein
MKDTYFMSSYDTTLTVVFPNCITSHKTCCFVFVNTRSIHLSLHLTVRFYLFTTIWCTMPQDKPRSDVIRRNVTCLSIWMSSVAFYRRRAASVTSIVFRCLVPAKFRRVPTFGNLLPWRHLSTVPFQEMLMAIGCRKLINPQNQHCKRIQILNCWGRTPARKLQIPWPWTLKPCVTDNKYLDFKDFGVSNSIT